MNYYSNESPYYDVALVCLNGHMINDSSQTSPQFNKKFCDKCGELTIDFCPKCKQKIQGDYKSPQVMIISGHIMEPPAFCHHCGERFPWTERKLAAAKAVADELDGINDEEKAKLKQSLEDMIKEGPMVEPAKLRFKSVMKKVGRESYDIMKSVVSDLVSEVVKKSLYGN